MTSTAIIVAAGSGARMGHETPKQFLPLGGKLVVDWSIEAFRNDTRITDIFLVVSTDRLSWATEHYQDAGIKVMEGGESRTDSVKAALKAVDVSHAHVFIHDAARPGVSQAMLDALHTALARAPGAAPALLVVDALKRREDRALSTVSRDMLYRVQTPQAFHMKTIQKALLHSQEDFVDDLQAVEAIGAEITLVDGDETASKITYPGDLERIERLMTGSASLSRIGKGYDVHAFTEGDYVTLCGVKIPHTHRLAGHSDADVAWHALTDAILGALALGDIGDHFPPSDERWRGEPSSTFLQHAVHLANQAGWTISNCDLTLICETPKIKPHREAMRAMTAKVADLAIEAVSVKATTTEGLGFTGRAEGIAAEAIVLLQRQR